ncbi:unnamed protein product [Soboliphyme baturini]|uniref:WS_DGAT_C domain-containing protein n=1 Tax=Soboliphyme baturini TaxID=241478 RepID=A0A183IEP8_9BILA|nr:unnamed protein product [Soboliphyme baturini]
MSMSSGGVGPCVFWASLLLCWRPQPIRANVKYSQRVFVDSNALGFADPLKHGFHVILSDEFIASHLQPTHLPTLFISAIPLNDAETRVTKLAYPENIQDGKLISIFHLQQAFYRKISKGMETYSRLLHYRHSAIDGIFIP